MISKQQNTIQDLSFKFALGTAEFCEPLEVNKKFVLLKSGTSIGANVREAQGAESRKDFVHKLKIAYKEAEETEYWLLICREAESYPSSDQLETQIVSIKKVLNKIIGTTRSNHQHIN